MKTKAFSLVFGILLFSAWWSVSQAQMTTAITPTTGTGNLGTTVNQSGNVFNITGGTRASTNLFHSFNLFSVGVQSGVNDIANFQNTQINGSFPSTSKIFSRVTGGQPSNIFGTIQTTDFGSANLFLINPAGVLFGSTASLNVQGSFHVSTADYIRFNDPSAPDVSKPRFYADPAQTSILTSFSPDAFGFLSSNPAAITFDNSFLSVPTGQTLSVVGGNITMTGGSLSAPGGQINLASVASPGEVLFPSLQNGPNVNGDVFTSMGTISLSTGATVDVSGDAAGTVVIRGGQFVIADATLSADTINTNGAPVAIDINVSGDISLSSVAVPALTARTSGSGDAGEVRILSANFNSTSSTATTFFALIDTHTSGAGKGGSVSLTTGNLTVSDDPFAPGFFIDSGTGGPGNGGNVTITAGKAQFTSTGIITGDAIDGGLGSGGNLTIKVDSLKLTTVSFATDSFNARAGDFSLEATGEIAITGNSFLSNISLLGESVFTIKADRFALDRASHILGGTALGTGGGITITAKAVELTNGSPIATQTFGDGDSGSIRVTATDHVMLLDGSLLEAEPSGFFTGSLGNVGLGTAGKAGTVEITTPQLIMTGGARIDSTTQTNGRGGDVTITAQSVSISGERPFDVGPDIFGLARTHASGISTRTVGSEFCTGPCGDAGNVNIMTGSLSLGTGAVIDSGTTSTGRGGDITIKATDTISLSGTLSDGTPGGIFSRTVGTAPGSGNGGNIELQGTQVAVMNGASVSASASGSGNAGSITIQGLASPADSVMLANSSLLTSADTVGRGGSITVDAANLTLSGATISASVKDVNAADPTDGASVGLGNIALTASTMNMTGGTITAATSGSRDAGTIAILTTGNTLSLGGGSSITSSTTSSGNAGLIVIVTPTLSLDNATVTTSTSSTGDAGTIAIITAGNTMGLAGGSSITSSTTAAGDAGTVIISTPALNLNDSTITTSTSSSGNAGSIVAIVGTATLTNNAQIASSSTGSATGAAGSVIIQGLASPADMVILTNSTIATSAEGTGRGGSISVDATNLMMNNGTISASVKDFGSAPDGASVGLGNIALTASTMNMSSGTVTAATTGTRNAGNILIQASDSMVVQNSSITTEAKLASGGNITLQAGRLIHLSSAEITTHAAGDGGSITIDPEFIIGEHVNRIITSAGVNGGDVTLIATKAILISGDTIIDPSGTLGISGEVTIQAPVTNLSGTLAPLPAKIVHAAALLQARCAARLAGGTSGSFVVAGRDGLPLEPGGLLPSPLYVEGERTTRLAESLGLPALQVGRPFMETSLPLVPLVIGCSS